MDGIGAHSAERLPISLMSMPGFDSAYGINMLGSNSTGPKGTLSDNDIFPKNFISPQNNHRSATPFAEDEFLYSPLQLHSL